MEKEINEVAIVFTINDNYACLVGVCLVSIFENLKKENLKRDFFVYVVDANISEANKSKLQEVAQKYKFKLEFVQIHLSEYEQIPETRYPKVAFYRFDVPIILSKHEKILYLDPDTTINADITELFDIDISENTIAAVDDGYTCFNYFNSGVMLINTKKWIENNVKQRSFNLIKEAVAQEGVNTKLLRFADQEVLNVVMRQIDNSHYIISHAWNIRFWSFIKLCKRKDVALLPGEVSAMKHPKIMHFTSKFKQFDYRCTHHFPIIWFLRFLKYKNKSPWKNDKITNVTPENIFKSLLWNFKISKHYALISFADFKNHLCVYFCLFTERFKNLRFKLRNCASSKCDEKI